VIAAFSPQTRLRALGALVLLATALGLLASPAGAQAEPPRTLDPYVAFADQRMTIHGTEDPDGGFLNKGSIGVNAVLPAPHDDELSYGGKLTAAPGTNIVANDANLTSNSSVWDVYANTINTAFENNPNAYHALFKGFSMPLLPDWSPQVPVNSTSNGSLPPLPPFTPSANSSDNLDPANNPAHVSPSPGVYRDLILRDDATVNLDDGVYVFNNVTQQGGQATITTKDGTIVRIAGQMHLGFNNQIIGSDLAQFQVRGDGLNPFALGDGGSGGGLGTGRAVFFNNTPDNIDADQNNDKKFHGQFLVPYHWMTLGNHNRMFGRFWAKGIHSDRNPDWNLRAPESVSGKKFSDNNGNGQQDGGEANLAGFTFYIDVNGNGQLDPGEPSAVSDANGDWSIGPVNLTGQYTVREVQQSGYTCTFPGTCTYTVDLGTDGDDHGGNDFGNKPDSPPCIPGPGQDANCQPVVTCVPGPGQDANCQPIITPTCVPKAGQDKNCNPLVVNSARMTGPSGCVTSSSVRVSGNNIRRVTFSYNGKKRTVKKSPFRLKVKKKQLKPGANRVTARIVFRDGKTQTSRLTLQRCGSNAVSPKFTG